MSKSLSNTPLYLAPGIFADSPTNIIDEYNHKQLYLNDDTKILIYEREVKGWFLDVAYKLITEDTNNNTTDNGFVVLMICLSYIEGVQQYKDGKKSGENGGSKKVFREGFKMIFPKVNVTDEQIDLFYSDGRCGLFHNGMIKRQTLINYGYLDPICFEKENLIIINPILFLQSVQNDFIAYIELLNDKTKLNEIQKFLNVFSID